MMFLPKPTLLINYVDITCAVFSRVRNSSSSKTFDIKIQSKNVASDFSFSNINKQEFSFIEEFFKTKEIKYKNELVDSVDGDTARYDEELDDESPDEDYSMEEEEDYSNEESNSDNEPIEE